MGCLWPPGRSLPMPGIGGGYLHVMHTAAAEMLFSTGHCRVDACHWHGIFIPPEWIVSYIQYLSAFIGCWVYTLHVCRVAYPSPPPPHVEDSSLRCVITRGGSGGWGWGGVCVLLFRGENDELAQEGKKCIRCQFHQSCFPHISAWLCLSQRWGWFCFSTQRLFCLVGELTHAFPYHALLLWEARLRSSPLKQTQRRG